MSTLTSTITESVEVNGSVRGSTNTVSISNITQVAEKVMECPPAVGEVPGVSIIGNWASVVNPTAVVYQNYDFNDSEYVRVTNLSETLPIEVGFVSTGQDSQCVAAKTADSYRVLLLPRQSTLLWRTEKGKLGEAGIPRFGITTLTNLSYIAVWNYTADETAAPVNVELFVAGKK